MKNADKLIAKYSQNQIKLKDSVIRVFRAVIESAKKMQLNSAPETNKMLESLINKLSTYLSQNSLDLTEYYQFIKRLLNNTGWKNINPSDKVKLITRPLEVAYQWMS